MDEYLRKQIYNNLDLRDTEELVEILQKNNRDEWDEATFEIIKEILFGRLGYLPPESIPAQVNQILDRVDSYLQAGQLDKALSDCQLAVQMAPESAIAYNYRGLIFDEMGQLEKAVADYQNATRLNPDFKDAWDNLRSLQLESEDTWNSLRTVQPEIEKGFQGSTAKRHLDQALAYAL